MNPAKLIAGAVVLIAALGVYLYGAAGHGSCNSAETTQSVMTLLQKNGRINFIEGEWIGATATPQFARADLIDARALDGQPPYRCTAMVVVDYHPAYVRQLLEDKGQALTGKEALHREFRIDYSPSPTGEEEDVQLGYRIVEQK
jgi:hypothetical protein